MAKLVYSLGGDVIGEFLLEKERTTIGRRAYNDIHLDNLAISGEHAVVIASGNQYYVDDLESTNGTLVNGKPIKRHKLQDGDVIGLGKYQLRFLQEGRWQNTGDIQGNKLGALEELPTISPDPANTDSSESPDAQEPVGDLPACLRVLNGKNAGELLALRKAVTTLGKPGVQVAAIARRSEGCFVVHVEGEPPPLVNGEMLASKSYPLQHYDILEVAGVRLEFLSTMNDG